MTGSRFSSAKQESNRVHSALRGVAPIELRSGATRLQAVVVSCSLALLVGAASGNGSAVLLAQVVGVAGLVAYAIHRLRSEEPHLGWLHPGILIFLFVGIAYVGRPTYILWSEEFGTNQLGRYAFGPSLDYMHEASLPILAAMTLFTVGFFVVKPDGRADGFVARLAARRPEVGVRLALLFGLSAVAAAAVMLAILQSYSSWQVALSLRADLFAGQQFLIFGLQLYRIGYLVWLGKSLSSWRDGSALTLSRVALAFSLWLPTFVFDFLTGSRADLIYRNIIPVTAVALLSLGRGRVRARSLLVPALAAVLLFVIIRVEVRDAAAAEASGSAARATVGSTLLELPEFILAGDEASVYDAYVIINGPSVLREGGRSFEGIKAVLFAPIPSALIDKPERGTTFFTDRARPGLAARGGNVAISGLGDAYLILGGLAGVLIYGALGVLFGGLVRRLSHGTRGLRTNSIPVVLALTVATSALPILRADLSELSLLPLRLGIPLLVCLWLSRPVQRNR